MQMIPKCAASPRLPSLWCPSVTLSKPKTHTRIQDWRCVYLQDISEVLVSEVSHSEIFLGIALHEPGAALALGVYEQRVSGGPGDQYAILDAELICRQPLQKAVAVMERQNGRVKSTGWQGTARKCFFVLLMGMQRPLQPTLSAMLHTSVALFTPVPCFEGFQCKTYTCTVHSPTSWSLVRNCVRCRSLLWGMASFWQNPIRLLFSCSRISLMKGPR